MKNYLKIIITVVVLYILWYLLSPLLLNIDANDADPLNNKENTRQIIKKPDPKTVVNIMNGMDEATKQKFEEEMETSKVNLSEMDEPIASPKLINQSELQPNLHEVAGIVKLIKNNDSYIIRLENFNSVIGPETHVYLANNKRASTFIDLGLLKANRGNINYKVVETRFNTKEYPYVLIWCKPFKVLFSYAEWKQQ